MVLPCPSCCPDCVYVRDAFDRETVGDDYTQDAGTWTIENEELKAGASARITHETPHPDGLPNIIASVRVKLPDDGATARLYIGDWSVEIEAAASGCGKLRLYDDSNTQLGPEVLVPDLAPDVFHSLKLCYGQESQVLSCMVTISGTQHRHHAKEVSIAEEDVLCGLATGDDAGDYFFDDFVLEQARHSDEDYYDDDCPCCAGGCEAETFTGTDCRWTDEAGTWTDDVNTTSTSSSNAVKLMNKGWSGLTPDCEADPTHHASMVVSGLDFGDQIELFIDWLDSSNNHSVVLTLNSAPETPDGTLKIYKDGMELESTLVNAGDGPTLDLCFDGNVLIANLNNTFSVAAATTAHGGHFFAIGTRTITGTPVFSQIKSNHNIYEDDCENCIQSVECDLCLNGEAPERLLVTISGMVDLDPPNGNCGAGACLEWNGTFVLDFRPDISTSALCQWTFDHDEALCNPPFGVVNTITARVGTQVGGVNDGKKFLFVTQGERYGWIIHFDDDVDCLNFSGVELAPLDEIGPICENADSKAVVTAI